MATASSCLSEYLSLKSDNYTSTIFKWKKINHSSRINLLFVNIFVKKLLCQILVHILSLYSLKFLFFKRMGGGDQLWHQHRKVVVKENLRNQSIVQIFLSKLSSEFAFSDWFGCPAPLILVASLPSSSCYSSLSLQTSVHLSNNHSRHSKSGQAWEDPLLLTRHHDHSKSRETRCGDLHVL